MPSSSQSSEDSRLPNPIIGALAEAISNALSHAEIDNLFVSINTSGESPGGNKLSKTQEWIKRFDQQHTNVSISQKLGMILGELSFRRPPGTEWTAGFWTRINEIINRHGYGFDGDRKVHRLGDTAATVTNNYAPMKSSLDDQLSIRHPASQDAISPHLLAFLPTTNPTPTISKIGGNRVFVIHGHDHGLKNTVARFLEKLDLKAIILHETPDGGDTIVEKLEKSTSTDFAVALLTPDDEGKSKASASLNLRARQNVIFEMGIFIGILGRSHVCAIVDTSVERPSDMDGVVYLPITGWKTGLLRRIDEAGLQYNKDKVTAALAIE